MPILSGIDATKLIRATHPEVYQPYILALTANVLEEDKRYCFEVGMDDFCGKPIVLRRLAALLTKYGRERALRQSVDSGE